LKIYKKMEIKYATANIFWTVPAKGKNSENCGTQGTLRAPKNKEL
jgi:hypothetical protein